MKAALWRALEALASLRLTVALFAAAMALIFAGTLAQATQGVWQVIDGYFRSPVAWVDLQLFVPRQLARVPGAVPVPGGYVIAGALIVNLIAAHAVRFKLSRKRIGILVLHAGLILLLAGEFVTGMAADEGLMSIDEGGSATYVEDVREVELALVDRSNPEHDTHVAIPQSMLEAAARTGRAVTHAALPFEVRVEAWMPNSTLARATGQTRATRGIGARAEAQPLPRVTGAEGAQVDAPSAYVTLLHDGEELGTWLVSVNLDAAQAVEADPALGRYDVALRFARTYKPYAIHLIDFRHDKFVGTQVARNFSSHVRIVDAARGVDREATISMNSPLRYAGETFYQASYKPDDSGTVLQVVRNPGWLIPYVACALVGGGMLLHFAVSLWSFLRRNSKVPAVPVTPAGAFTSGPVPRRGVFHAALPWAVGAAGLALAMSGLFRPADDSAYDVATFARLPVSEGGRVKPMDTVARNALMLAGGRQSVTTDAGTVSASRFLLDLMARPEVARDYPVVRVDHPDVLSLLGRDPSELGRLTLAEIEPHWGGVAQQAAMAEQVPPKRRDPFQRAVLGLYQKVDRLLALSQMQAPYAIPPLAPGEEWRPFHEAFAESHNPTSETPQAAHPGVGHVVSIMTAYHEQRPEAFNAALASYDEVVRRALPTETRRADLEVWFNRASLFYGATLVYVLAFLGACAALLLRLRPNARPGAGLPESLRRSAVILLVVALVVQTIGIALRIHLQGRPPVTNLYSSAVFIGWACVLMGLFMERIFPLGLAALGSAAVGFGTLVVAHNLGTDGDTMQMMQAVLDSNFWLATHVITIALGYSATFLAGFLAILYLLLGLFTRHLTPERAKALAKMVYGTICFALLLSFVGTVLGGIWADQSWGRFWGWDPKENGAALIVLITALILHARWGGLIRQRGLMVLAVGGNVVTAWSWFGTNMLGVGLHSYGFIDSAVFWLMAFVVSQLALMALGLLPARAWRSGLATGGAAT